MAVEADLWQLTKNNTPLGFFKRFEDRLGTGTPDVYYCIRGTSGWIELKHLYALPKRPATPVRVDHFTADQRGWHKSHAKSGGVSWFWMRAGDEFFLLKGWVAAASIGKLTAEELRASSVYHCNGRVDWPRFWGYIISGGR